MEVRDMANTGCLTTFACQLIAPSLNTSVLIPPACGNAHKATLLDCEQWNSAQEAADYEYFLCGGQHNSSTQCSHCAGNSTAMLNMTLRLLLLGDEGNVVWARIPSVIKSVSCSVGGFIDMFMDCTSPENVNVTSEDIISTVGVGNASQEELSLWQDSEWNKSAALRDVIGEYVKCSLQSVLLNVESTTGGASVSSGVGDELNWESHHHDWSFLFVLVFIVAGGVGNILVCLAVCLDRRLQNVTNYFLLSLAIADLLVSLFVMPLGAIPGFLGKLIPKYFLTFYNTREKTLICVPSRQPEGVTRNISAAFTQIHGRNHGCI
jgi:hypothetical protein